ncbi:hypothetical protein ACFL6S_00380 [Candidatus Poribacteria bacterium]
MREITTREKAFLSIGALAAVAIFVYFVLLPMLQTGGEEQKSSLEGMQERLVAVQKLAGMKSMLVDLEDSIGEQSGYKKISFKSGSAGPSMINYIAETAQQAGIKELEQLDAKPDTSRKRTDASGKQDVLGAIIDGMYMAQVRNEIEQAANSTDENATENEPSDESAEEDVPEEAEGVELEGQEDDPPDKDEDSQAEEQSEEDNGLPDEDEGDQVKDQADSNASEESETAEPVEDVEQVEQAKLVFPPIPRGEGMSDEVRKSLAKSIESRQGKTLKPEDIKGIMDEAGVPDAEKTTVGKRLQLYSNGVNEKKLEIGEHFRRLGILKSAKLEQQMDIFSIKMVFKSRIDQLVKFMYTLQDSARWIKVDSMRIGISERKETVLSVELSMTATALYDI